MARVPFLRERTKGNTWATMMVTAQDGRSPITITITISCANHDGLLKPHTLILLTRFHVDQVSVALIQRSVQARKDGPLCSTMATLAISVASKGKNTT